MLHPVFVHFPHPGAEHYPGRMSRQPWNTNRKHRRKFLRSPGQYVATAGSLAEAPLAFWAEWEAPSYVIQRWLEGDHFPRFLQEPRWERPRIKGFRQNTDPWVFGDCFRYSNCHQLNQRGLQNLAPGSVILFGSTLGLASGAGPRFVLDALFVVAEQRQRFTPADPPDTDEAFVFPRLNHWLRATIRIPVGLPIPAAVRVCVSRCTTVRPTRRRSTGSTRLSRAGGQIAKIFALLGRRCHYQ